MAVTAGMMAVSTVSGASFPGAIASNMQGILSLPSPSSCFLTNDLHLRLSPYPPPNLRSSSRPNIVFSSLSARLPPQAPRPFLFPPSTRLRSRRPPPRVQATKKTYSTFDELLNNTDTALLVDFYATWCGPCQFMVPVLESVGKALKDELRIVKIDTEKYPNIASRYGVQALPTLMLFRNGQPIDRLEGAMPAPELIKRIKAVLSTPKAKARE